MSLSPPQTEFMIKKANNQPKGCFLSDKQSDPKRNIDLSQQGTKVSVGDSIGKVVRNYGKGYSLVVDTYMAEGFISPDGSFSFRERSGQIPQVGVETYLIYKGRVTAFSPRSSKPIRIDGVIECWFGQNQPIANGSFSMVRSDPPDQDRDASRKDTFEPLQPQYRSNDDLSLPSQFQNWATQNKPPSWLENLADQMMAHPKITISAIAGISAVVAIGAAYGISALVAGSGTTTALSGSAVNFANALNKFQKVAPTIAKQVPQFIK